MLWASIDVDIIDDATFLELCAEDCDRQFFRFLRLVQVAKKAQADGEIRLPDGRPATARTLSIIHRESVTVWDQFLKTCTELSLIRWDSCNECFVIIDWRRWHRKPSDDSAERVKKHRASKKNGATKGTAKTKNVTPCNAPVTPCNTITTTTTTTTQQEQQQEQEQQHNNSMAPDRPGQVGAGAPVAAGDPFSVISLLFAKLEPKKAFDEDRQAEVRELITVQSGVPPDVLVLSARLAAGTTDAKANKNRWNYFRRVFPAEVDRQLQSGNHRTAGMDQAAENYRKRCKELGLEPD